MTISAKTSIEAVAGALAESGCPLCGAKEGFTLRLDGASRVLCRCGLCVLLGLLRGDTPEDARALLAEIAQAKK